MRIYFDHNATTPIDPRVRQISARADESFGNPSSVHAEGRAARDAVERARRQVAALCAGDPEEIVFTSGGTEADCLGIVGLARLAASRGAPRRALSTAIEHPAVHGALAWLREQGWQVEHLPVDDQGRLDPDTVTDACTRPTGLLACSLANHELGTVQDIAGIATIAARAGALVHVDAVQAAGKVPLDCRALGAHSVALSAHKLHGPRGVGALWIQRGLSLPPLFAAGHQERERRPGTENVPGIVGMGLAQRQQTQHQAAAGSEQLVPAEGGALHLALRRLLVEKSRSASRPLRNS